MNDYSDHVAKFDETSLYNNYSEDRNYEYFNDYTRFEWEVERFRNETFHVHPKFFVSKYYNELSDEINEASATLFKQAEPDLETFLKDAQIFSKKSVNKCHNNFK